MNRGMRYLTGLLSIAAPFGLFVVGVAEAIVRPSGRSLFDAFNIGLGILGLMVMIGFIVHALRTESVPQEKRGLWVAVLLLGNFLALPFYWMWYVRQPSQK